MGLLQNLVHTINQKLGNSTDNWPTHRTVLGYTNVVYQHIHNRAYCYPSLADGVLLSTGNGSWVLGNIIEIVPQNTIQDRYDIHFLVSEGASSSDIYEIVLYSGNIGSEVEIARVRTSKETNNSGTSNIPIQIAPLNSNTRLSARIASQSSGIDTMTVSIFYHIYG